MNVFLCLDARRVRSQTEDATQLMVMWEIIHEQTTMGSRDGLFWNLLLDVLNKGFFKEMTVFAF